MLSTFFVPNWTLAVIETMQRQSWKRCSRQWSAGRMLIKRLLSLYYFPPGVVEMASLIYSCSSEWSVTQQGITNQSCWPLSTRCKVYFFHTNSHFPREFVNQVAAFNFNKVGCQSDSSPSLLFITYGLVTKSRVRCDKSQIDVHTLQ